MRSEQPSFTDIEYGQRRRVSKREEFLDQMDSIIPWQRWIGVIEPHYYVDAPGKRGRKAKPVETMLRMYLLQIWFNLSDEGVEDAIYDSYAMRQFMGLDFGVEQVPDATTLLAFRHLMEEHHLGEELFAAQNEIFEEEGWIMRGGSIVDATIIAAPETLPLREVLHAHGEEFRSLLEKYSAKNPRLFGSVARGTAGEASDIDILVEMDPADGNLLMRASGLMEETRLLFGREDIDIFPVQLLKHSISESALVDAIDL